MSKLNQPSVSDVAEGSSAGAGSVPRAGPSGTGQPRWCSVHGSTLRLCSRAGCVRVGLVPSAPTAAGACLCCQRWGAVLEVP